MTSRIQGPTAEFLSKAIDRSGATHAQIAREAGFSAPNVISMMRLGNMKVPIDRIPAIALACGVNERYFLRIALQEYQPEVWEVLKSSFGEILTEAEQDLLTTFRIIDQDGEIEVDAVMVQALLALFELASERMYSG